jgi:ubiquitin carboxyl-terminal hydrolase 47
MSYKGLANVGATCYINSLIQTLFMTPEFRDSIYGWSYNDKIHPRREDSILYQLQKLFGRLELGLSASTSDLIRSFQWHEDDAFLQQDIQEFNRVLFEAIEKSLILSTQPHLIKELYEGQLVHFTKCLQCHSESAREEGFQDLILVIKNLYERVYSGCLELSLQRYIKPELLDEHNLYDCGQCEQKVRAQRGVKFVRLPKLLNLVLQRFHFDYDTLTRNKINDAFAFPYVLNFNHFFNGYDHIPNRLSEDSSQYFLA